MPYFEYSKSTKDDEYYEILEMLMERCLYFLEKTAFVR